MRRFLFLILLLAPSLCWGQFATTMDSSDVAGWNFSTFTDTDDSLKAGCQIFQKIDSTDAVIDSAVGAERAAVAAEADSASGFTHDGIKDYHIDWGTGTGQVSTDDITEGSSNLFDQALPDSGDWSTAYSWGDHSGQNYLDEDNLGTWKVFYSDDGTEDWVELALGADGTYLKSTGASSAPTFATPPGGDPGSAIDDSIKNGWQIYQKIDTTDAVIDSAVGAERATITLKADSALAFTHQGIKKYHTDSTSENFVFDGAYHITSAEIDSQFMSKKYIDDATGGLSAQSVKGDHVDSTAEDFVFDGAYHITSEEADSAYLTHGGAAATYITATLTEEEVEDYAGGMVTGNTETRIAVTYEDDDGTFDFVVDSDPWDSLTSWANKVNTVYDWGDHSGEGYITATLTEEEVEDFVGTMVDGGTETRISVTYTDGEVGAGLLNFVVDDMNDGDATEAEIGDTIASHWSVFTAGGDPGAEIHDSLDVHWDEWLHISGGTMTGALDMGDGAVYNAERVEADSVCIGGTLANQVLSVVGNIATGDTATGDVDVYHYFSTDNSWTTEYLMWDDGNARFDLSSKLYVEGYIMADGHILRLNVIGSNNDCVIEFGKPSPAEEETLRWNKTDNRFEFSSDLYVNGTVSSSNLLTKSFTIQAIDSDHDIKLWKTPVAITIDSIFGQCDGGTNVIGALDEYDWDNTDLVAVVNADWTFTTTYQAVGSFTNAGIAAKNHLKWHTTSVSGTVNFFDLTIWYHED